MPKFFTKIIFVVSFLLSAFSSQYLLAQRTDFSPKYLANITLTTGTLVQAFNPMANTYTINVSSDVNNVGIKFTTDPLGYLFLNWKTPVGFSTANPAITGYANQSTYYNYAVTDTPYTFPVSVWYVGRRVYTGHSPSYYDDAMNYFFTIHRIASNVLLTNIAVNGGELSTNFDPLQPNYDIATTASSITIKPTIKDSTSIVTVNGQALTADGLSVPIQLSYNTNANITVKVTATDSTSFTYNLNATRIVPPNLALSALTLSKGTLSPQFNSNVIQYTADVNSTVSSINLTPVLKDPSATVAVNGVNVASGQQSADIPLQTGDTPVTVVVKSTQDSTQTYSVTVKQEGAASLLKSLTSSIQLDTAFTPTDFSYTATVNYDATNISLTPTAAYAGATIYINGAEVTDGTANSLPLAFGNNIFTIAVTGTDLATKTYTLSITRLAAATLLTDIKLDAGTLSPVFDPLTWTYSVNVNAGRSDILITPVIVDSTAIVKINGQLFDKENATKISLNQGLNIITLVVTKTGDIDRTYTLNITRAKIPGFLPLSNIPFVYGGDEHNYTDAWFATVPSTTTGFTPASINGGGYLNTVSMNINDGGWTYAGHVGINYGVTKVELAYTIGPRYGPWTHYDLFYYITRLLPQTITFDPQNKYVWDDDFAPAISTTDNPITYTSSNPSVATVSEGKIHITGVGVTTITATQPGDAQYEAASVTQTLTIGKKAQLITFAAESKIFTDKDFIAATTSSKLALVVTSSNLNVATVINGKVHLVGAGTTTITASQAGNDTYDEATLSQTLTVTQSAQTISFAAETKTLADIDFVPAAVSSKLPIVYTSSNNKVATIVNGKVHLVGAGTTIITASQAGNSNYAPVTQSQEFSVTQAAQTIAFVTQTKTYGDPDFLPATTTSGLPITYSSANWDVASIADGKIHIEKAGKVIIWADQPGSKAYSVAESVSSTITINKAPQTITFAALSKSLGDADFAPATVNSKLPLTYTSSNTKVATVVNGKIHLVGLGTATINASQKGNENYLAASLSQVLTITKASQTITFPALTKIIGDADFSPATISSALVITYTSSNSKVATIVKGKVHIVGVGTATITASQPGDGNYTAAKSVAQTLTVMSKASQTITFAATAAKTYGDADFAAAATASSKLPVSYTSSNTKIATIVNGKIHIIAAGVVTITASQAGNDVYAAAKSVNQKLTIAKAQQTATFAVTGKTYGDADFVPAKASTGLPLSYIVSDAKVASLVNGKLHIASAGSVSIVIYQQGNGNYDDLTLTQKFTIAKAPLTITADNKSKKTGTANPALTATYKGFVNGDDKNDLTTQPKLTTTATTSSKAGSYAITASGAVAKNYAIVYVAGKLTVTASAVKTNSFDIDEIPQPVVSQALSPNGDGLNDVLTITNIKTYPDNSLTVMDVNGNNVYEVKGYDNQERVFDGHSSKTHAMQKQGTYYYILQYKDGDDSKKLTGYIIMKY